MNVNNLLRANISVVVDIKVARAYAELHHLREELKQKEEVYAQELQDTANVQGEISHELEQAELEMGVMESNTTHTRETIVVAQAVL